MSLKTPLPNELPQDAEPEYVPSISVLVMFVALPLMPMVQVGNPDTPPAGTVIENVKVEPAIVPVRFPRKTTAPDVEDAVIEPDTFEPDCVSAHVI